MMNSGKGELKLEEIMIKDRFLSNTVWIEDGSIKLRGQVDAIIENWFIDMWLLVSDYDLGDSPLPVMDKDHRVLAMAYQGQLHLLESKVSTLSALRSVGIWI
jgi:hypothetical protein